MKEKHFSVQEKCFLCVEKDDLCNVHIMTDITSNKSTNVVKGERNERLENM